jgi:beta-glucosidase
VTYLSRADHFANYDAATAAPTDYSMSDEQKASFVNTSNYDSSVDDDGETMPTTGASNGVQLSDLRGLSYDDSKWDSLLDQLTVDDMNTMISMNGYSTGAVSSVGKVQTTDCDGPSAINNNFTGKGSIGFPSNTTIACTWNKDLAKAYGTEIGTMCNEMGVSGWYAPAMNTHRNALGGRNFEYYSEDPTLSGVMASQAELGASEKGVYGYIKHFALNDQETNRMSMICTWSNEQAIREIYLKPFEYCVKDGNATAVMSSYSYIGTTWAGGDSNLLQDVLRGEWGFEGFVQSDYYACPYYMNADQSVRNGGDSFLATINMGTNTVQNTDASGVTGLRNACHNIMYTVVNSSAYADGGSASMPLWQIIAIVVDVIVAALLALWLVLAIRKYRRTKTTNPPTDDVKQTPSDE